MRIRNAAIISFGILATCSSSERQYLITRQWVPGTFEYANPTPDTTIWSPAKDQSPGKYKFYAVLSENEVRKLGFAPETMQEYKK